MGITWTMPNAGLYDKLGIINSVTQYGWIKAGLFENALTVSDSTSLANLTDASFPGYTLALIPQTATVMGAYTSTPSLSWSSVTFTCTGSTVPHTIWGGYVRTTNLTPNEVLVVANLPNGPQVVSQNGDSIVLQLTLTDQRAPGQP